MNQILKLHDLRRFLKNLYKHFHQHLSIVTIPQANLFVWGFRSFAKRRCLSSSSSRRRQLAWHVKKLVMLNIPNHAHIYPNQSDRTILGSRTLRAKEIIGECFLLMEVLIAHAFVCIDVYNGSSNFMKQHAERWLSGNGDQDMVVSGVPPSLFRFREPWCWRGNFKFDASKTTWNTQSMTCQVSLSPIKKKWKDWLHTKPPFASISFQAFLSQPSWHKRIHCSMHPCRHLKICLLVLSSIWIIVQSTWLYAMTTPATLQSQKWSVVTQPWTSWCDSPWFWIKVRHVQSKLTIGKTQKKWAPKYQGFHWSIWVVFFFREEKKTN